MVKALFDTNILIDYLNGVPDARNELDRYDEKAISIVTWMEVMVGAAPAVETATRTFLACFGIVALDNGVAERAIAFRKARKAKLPDAIIWASAQADGLLLVTRNVKDFPVSDPGVRMPYKI
jgi:predicted nucleic acid-binding protein